MKTSIILGDQSILTDLTAKQQERKLVHFSSAEEAYLYQLDHPGDVDSYVLDTAKFIRTDRLGIIRNITFLNELVRIFLIGKPDDASTDKPLGENVEICDSLDEIAEGLNKISGGHRQFSRVRWPVAVVFSEKETPDIRQKGSVISISSGGCLIASDTVPETDTAVIMTIIFKNFDFLAEGVVVRREQGKFAVRLKNITSQTRELIQEIINERILVELKGIH